MSSPKGNSTFRTAAPTPPERVAAGVLMLGAFAVVLAALPYKAFDLERFYIPKELALFVTAAAAAVFLLDRARQLAVGWVDALLAGWLTLSIASAAASSNWWLATRAVGVSLASVTMFWVARALGRTRLAYRVAAGLAGACIAASGVALLQAYGLVDTELFSPNRVPGGTLGNRNFVAHLAAIGLPATILVVLESRRALGVLLGAAGVGIASWMLVLSRTRAAWLGLALSGGVLLVAAWRFRSLVMSGKAARRIVLLALLGGAAATAALFLPNRLRWSSDDPYLETALGVVNFREGSGRGRVIQFRNSLALALDNPVLGVGPGNWSVEYPRVAERGDPSLNAEGMTSNPWPSSDWAAFLSERGVPAFVLLVGVFLALGADALRKLLGARTPTEAREALALAGTLLVTAVVGAFDAVLLLGAPSLIAWGLFGILAPPGSRWTVSLSEGIRHSLLVVAATVGAILIVRSSSQIVAMSVYPERGLRALGPIAHLRAVERASRADPGNYRLHMRAATGHADRGNCRRARAHAEAARYLYPHAPEPGKILRQCR
ncbi:MAG: O-antigen ligase family protein [Gemmatimonadota bacterium]|nr:O-antigen ligase family protein [Gemmatimonadota bacterium]